MCSSLKNTHHLQELNIKSRVANAYRLFREKLCASPYIRKTRESGLYKSDDTYIIDKSPIESFRAVAHEGSRQEESKANLESKFQMNS